MQQHYEKYKPSGIEWIGEIPEHWRVEKFKYNNRLITENGTPDNPKIGLENIASGAGKFIKTNTTFEGEGISFKKGDVLFGKLRPYLAKVYLAEFNGNAVGDFFVYRSKNEPRFQFYQIIDDGFIRVTNSSTFGAKMPRVSWDFIANLKLPLPPKPEQTAIAEYLDRKTVDIDALIARKEQLLALYAEEKTAIINEAVTRGLNPDAPLKDSGIPWLGSIPAHWEVKKLKYIADLNPSRNPFLKKDSEQLVVFLPMEKVSEDGCIDCEIKKTISELYNGFTYFEKNDVIIAKITPCFENGKGAFLDKLETDLGFGSTEFHVIRGRKTTNPKFIYYITRSARFMKIGEAFMTGAAGQKRVPTDFVSEFNIAFPKYEEQTKIIEYIEHQTARIDTIMTRTRKLIDLLKEYRTALISEVVTGKIKVTA